MKIGDIVEVAKGRKEEGQVGVIKIIRAVPSKHDYIVFFPDGDSNDFKADELLELPDDNT
jgi:hypothetical protein